MNTSNLPKHYMAPNGKPDGYPQRECIPNAPLGGGIRWDAKCPGPYTPPYFDHPLVLTNSVEFVGKVRGCKGWADPPHPSKVDFSSRMSYYGIIAMDAATGYPLNPVGRTGLLGRGLLGKWGPNHAGDAIVTRWNDDGKLEFVAIKRSDNGKWAVPGGMKEPNEPIAATVIREFVEEATRQVTASDRPHDAQAACILATNTVIDGMKEDGGEVVFKGYVDDPRNTDNAWIETCALHWHLSDEQARDLHLCAGDDAVSVRWMVADATVTPEYADLHASHKDWVDEVVKYMTANKEAEESRSPAKRQRRA